MDADGNTIRLSVYKPKRLRSDGSQIKNDPHETQLSEQKFSDIVKQKRYLNHKCDLYFGNKVKVGRVIRIVAWVALIHV